MRSHRSERLLRPVVVDLEPSVFGVARQRDPVAQRVADGCGERALRYPSAVDDYDVFGGDGQGRCSGTGEDDYGGDRRGEAHVKVVR